MRNLAEGNKLNFTIFAIIVIIIIGILIFSVNIGIKNEKEKYQISSSCCLYDKKYNYISLENAAQISKKWTGSYYLKENITKAEYNLGSYAVSYDTSRKSIELFGTFYQVLKGGEIKKYVEHNNVNKTSESQFYKIDDRKYLIIAKDIKNNTGSLSAQNYLMVIMDKLGNALLLNDQINAKTINQMTISTSDFDFDVGNEILIYGEEKINLKKIIGSTNQYTPVQKQEENTEEDVENEIEETIETDDNEEEQQQIITTTNDSTNINNSSTTIISPEENKSTENDNNDEDNKDNEKDKNDNENKNGQNNIVDNDNSNVQNPPEEDNSWVDSLNEWINNVASGFQSIYNGSNGKKDDNSLAKSISLNKLTSGTTYLDIDYAVVDPENKYNVVYALVSNNIESQVISLDKNATTYRVTGLKPDTNYIVEMGYKIIKSDSSVKESVEDTMHVRTKVPKEELKITKISTTDIYYNLKLDSNFVYDVGCNLTVYLNDEIEYLKIPLTSENLSESAGNGFEGSFSIPAEYKQKGSTLKIVLENTKRNGEPIEKDLMSKIINY